MSSTWVRALAASVVIVLIGSTVGLAGEKFGKISDEEWQAGAPSGYPEAGAVVLFSIGEMDVTPDLVATKYHYRIKVLTEAGIEEVGDRHIRFHKERDKLKGFKAHTVAPDGKRYEVKGEAIFEKTAGDWLEQTFAYPNVTVGSILECTYEIRSDRFTYLSPWYFQGSLYTLRSQFSVTLQPGFSYDVDYQNVPPQYRTAKEERTPNPEKTIGVISMINTYTWTVHDQPPIKDEPFMSCEDDYRASMRFQIVSYTNSHGDTYTFAKNWTETGEIVQKWIKDYAPGRTGVERLTTEVTAGLTDDHAKSKAIFRHVAAEFKTTDEINYGWFLNDRIDEFLKSKIGSAEEKNLLVTLMHEAAGLTAYPVLISTRSEGKLNPRFPSVMQFNYLVSFAQLGQEWEFLDVSNPHAVYGILPPDCLTNGGLLIEGPKSELVAITIKPTPSYRDDLTRVWIDGEGRATCSTTCSFTGYYASATAELYDQHTPEDFVKEYFEEPLNAVAEFGSHTGGLDSAGRFVLSTDFTSDDLARVLDNSILVKQAGFEFAENPFKSEKRCFPVDFRFPFTYRNTVEIHPTGALATFAPPENLTFSIPGALLKRTSEAAEGVVRVSTELTIETPEFLPIKYGAVREFFGRVATAMADEVTVTLTGAR